VQVLESAQKAAELASASLHGTFGWQLSVTEQISSAAQALSSGRFMHRPAKQVLLVQPTPSSQSSSLQHSSQSPLQHLSGPVHFAAAAQTPSTVQKSFVHRSPSLQSWGPTHFVTVPLPDELVPPDMLAVPPAEAAPWPPLALWNSPPEQAPTSSRDRSTNPSDKDSSWWAERITLAPSWAAIPSAKLQQLLGSWLGFAQNRINSGLFGRRFASIYGARSSDFMKRYLRAALCLASSLLVTISARAESRRLDERWSAFGYRLHGGLAAGGLLLTGLGERAFQHHGAGPYWHSLALDDVVEQNFSQSSAELSDKLLLASVGLPVALQMSDGLDTGMANATLIYAQAHALNLFLTASTKLIVRRPRPYTRYNHPRIDDFTATQGGDAYVSFFSGHSSASFTAATAGSILYSARSDVLWARHAVWGLEFLLAGTTAQLRVRAGRHYRSDIWTGTVVGVGIGLLVPTLHRVELSRVRTSELATAGGAMLVTMVGSELVDFCAILGKVGLCDLPRDVPVPPVKDELPAVSYYVLPAVFEGGAGLSINGDF
jgi:membrane-associated phospholipid phosphatase